MKIEDQTGCYELAQSNEGWKIVDEFVSQGIRCFIAKLERGEGPDNIYAKIFENGFYQYNGYCVIPACHSLRGIVDKYEYAFLSTHLKDPNRIANYKIGNPQGYDIHGGITYRDWGYGDLKQYPRTEWIIGFDTAHLGDFEDNSVRRGYKKDAAYVKYECKRLAEQIAEEVKR